MNASIIIPCYLLPDKNVELLRFTENCINSIRKYSPYCEIVIIDNGSPIGFDYLVSVADVYYRFDENKGFAPAVNKGFELATRDWFVVCNNDVEFIHDWPWFAFDNWLVGETGVFCSHLHDHDPEHTARTVNKSIGHFFGALWMIHHTMYKMIGGLDESYQIGMYEDKDYVQRIKKSGYQIRKGGWCKHVGNATWGKMQNQHEIFMRNKAIYDEKWSTK